MHDCAKSYLDRAALVALRAAGCVEPNPLVGCVIVKDGRVIGIGHHRRFGGPHAEREALADCRRHNEDPAGATVYVTLEPCKHRGKTPPCTEALIEAGVSRVVCARPDPGGVGEGGSGGGKAVLEAAGIPCGFDESSEPARLINEPFVKRARTGLPWVIAKWAQTIDGRIATRTGESQWISGPVARRRVHRLRGRVDAILTGIGTVLADDPRLTARDAGKPRRIARRVVVDPRLRIPMDSALIRSIREASSSNAAPSSPPPITIATTAAGVRAEADKARQLRALVEQTGLLELLELPPSPSLTPSPSSSSANEVCLSALLAHLAARHHAANVLVECGPGLLGRLLRGGLVDECLVYLAPIVMGDADAIPVAWGVETPRLADASRWRLVRSKPVGPDIELRYLRLSGT